MCGRFTLSVSGQELTEEFGVPELSLLAPRFNIAPSQSILSVRKTPGGQRECANLKWGLIPSWSKDDKMGARLINARAETAAQKPSFRSAFRQRRCIVPASGFYEWHNGPSGKQAFLVKNPHNTVFGIAALWESWQNHAGEDIQTCTLLTTQANDVMQAIHHRMPVILDKADYTRWLDTPAHSAGTLSELWESGIKTSLQLVPVSTRVNSPANDDAACIEPIGNTL